MQAESQTHTLSLSSCLRCFEAKTYNVQFGFHNLLMKRVLLLFILKKEYRRSSDVTIAHAHIAVTML